MLGFLPSSMSVCGAENAQPQLSTPAKQTFWPNNTQTNKKKHNWKWLCLKTMSRKTLGACISFHYKKNKFIIASSSAHVIWNPTIYFVQEQMLHLEQVVRANLTRLIPNQTPSIHRLTTLRAGWGFPPSNSRIDDWWQMWLYPLLCPVYVCIQKNYKMWWYHLSGHCVLLPAGFFFHVQAHELTFTS